MTHSVSRHLKVDPAEYDAAIVRFIPGYREMVDRATAAVAAAGPALVLDLGAGTGALSERLLARAPEVVVELWDVDDAMLEVARHRLARFGERARFIHRSFDEPFPSCGAMMASLALHHVGALAVKAALYARAAAALRPGGVFVNADVTVPGEAPRQAASYRFWADHMVANGIDERQAWRHFEDWAGEDRYFSAEEELAALRSAGLEAAVVWECGPAGVMVGRRGGGVRGQPRP